MAIQSPFSFLNNLAGSLGKGIALPPWLVQEVQRRFVLTVNHVLQQEPEAQDRLATQAGKSVYVSWRQFNGQVRITPAGLLDLDDVSGASDLLLEVAEPSVTKLVRSAVEGTRPPIRIAGDVELASQLNWVIDNVRWDLEDDLARIIGDVPAHKLTQVGRRIAEALRTFVQGAMTTVGGLVQRRRDAQAEPESEQAPAATAGTSPQPAATAAHAAPEADMPPGQPGQP
ncbi:hypothetical protein [Lampropedia cohaerens]|uniref:hypothetical protein n=1 Tax=Lampropedia cohaerens TaxID=1610491 RepID=UPI0018D2718B|nr:hypothetical protein [Lampropedia cohaerens]